MCYNIKMESVREYDPLTSTHEDISDYIGWLEELADANPNISLTSNDNVMQLQESMERRVADAASDMKIGYMAKTKKHTTEKCRTCIADC